MTLWSMHKSFNIINKTTGAESPWSNGMCEKHNGILNNKVKKVLMECIAHYKQLLVGH